MAGASMHVNINEKDLAMKLSRFMAGARDMRPAMKDIGEYMMGVTDERFAREEDPSGRPWQPHSPLTLMIAYGWTRRRKDGSSLRRKTHTKKGGLTAGFERYAMNRKILTLSARLRKSIHYQAAKDSVVIGTDAVYAAIHQFGGKAGRGRKVSIPARPYLGISDADRSEAVRIIKEHLRSMSDAG